MKKVAVFLVLLSLISVIAILNVSLAQASLTGEEAIVRETSSNLATGPCSFFDDFSDSSSGWPVSQSNAYDVGYENDQYKMQMDTRVFWIRNLNTFCNDPHIEVDTSVIDFTNPYGHSIRYGIMFRYTDFYNWYSFEVSPDGYFRVQKRIGGTFTNVLPWTYSDVINQGLANNHLVVDAIGTRITVSANGQMLATTSDASLSSGFAGLMTGTSVDQNVWVYFDNFAVAPALNPTLTVDIDIKPGSVSNCLNSNGNGVIPVAILSSPEFDATQVDQNSVKLDSQTIRIVGKMGILQAHIEDANVDGLDDLVVQIEDVDGTYEVGDSIATLTATTQDGDQIQGTDTLCIVP